MAGVGESRFGSLMLTCPSFTRLHSRWCPTTVLSLSSAAKTLLTPPILTPSFTPQLGRDDVSPLPGTRKIGDPGPSCRRPAHTPQPRETAPLQVRRAPATRQQLTVPTLSSRSRRSKRQPGNWWMDAMNEHRVHAARQPVPSSSQHSPLSQPATRVRCRFGRLHRLRALRSCLHVPRTDFEDS